MPTYLTFLWRYLSSLRGSSVHPCNDRSSASLSRSPSHVVSERILELTRQLQALNASVKHVWCVNNTGMLHKHTHTQHCDTHAHTHTHTHNHTQPHIHNKWTLCRIWLTSDGDFHLSSSESETKDFCPPKIGWQPWKLRIKTLRTFCNIFVFSRSDTTRKP